MKAIMIIGFLCLGIWQGGGAQDLRQDMIQVLETYLDSEALGFEIEIAAFKKGDKVKPFYRDKAKYAHAGDQLFLDFNGLIRMVNSNEVLVIDKPRKLINVFPKNRNDIEKERKELSNMLNGTVELANVADEVKFVELGNGIKRYTLFPESEDFKQIDIEIQASPFFLSKIIYTYNSNLYPETSTSVVKYNKVVLGEEVKIEDVSNEYLNKAKKEYQLKSAYENYELVLHENK